MVKLDGMCKILPLLSVMISKPNLNNSVDSTVLVMFQNLLPIKKCFDLLDFLTTEESPNLLSCFTHTKTSFGKL